MALFVRTGNTGLNPAVKINDLGVTIQPGVSFQEITRGSDGNPFSGAGQFTPYELYKSADLYTLINNGSLEASSDGVAHDIALGSYTTTYAIATASRSDPSSDIPQYVTVGKGGNVDFTSVKEAIDSITDSSLAKIYTVFVYPGVYVEDTITMKTGINLVGIGNLVVIIAPSDPTKDILIAADVTSIFGIIFSGQLGYGTSSVTYTSSSPDHSNTVLLQNCFFATNDIHVNITGGASGTFTNVEMVGCRFGGLLSNFVTGIKVHNPDGGQALLSMSSCNMFSADAAIPDFFLDADGYGTFISMSSCDIATKQIAPSTGTGIHISDGASISTTSVTLSGWNKGIWAENAGSAPAIKAVGSSLFDNQTDLLIEHPGTTGSFSGVLTFDKTTIDSNSTFALSGGDLPSGSVIILSELRFGKSVATATDVGDLILSDPTLGVSAGGTLSEGSGFNVNVSSGFGYVEIAPFPNTQLSKITWANTSILLTANTENYIYFNSLGVLSAASFFPDSTQNIILGRVVTHGTGIDFIDAAELNANHAPNFLDQTLRAIFGATYVSGSIVTDAGSRQLNVSNGLYYLSQHKYTPMGASPVSFTNYYRNGSGGFTRQFGQTQINNTQYDDGTGTLATMTDGYYAKHVLYIVGDGYDEKYMVVFSQNQYTSSAEAETSYLPTPPGFFEDGVTPLASIVIQKSSSSIFSIKDERNIRGNSPTALAAAADHGNLLGLLDDDHPQYMLTDGTRTFAGNLNMGGFNINSVNLVDGVDISSHAARHLPNGADPLTTATPVTVAAANSIGVANSFARSDHVHSHGNLGGGTTHAAATTSVAGFLSAADKTRLDILSQETTILAVRNESGSTIGRGRLVAVTGYNSLLNVLLIGLADKDIDSLRPAIGITRTDIPNNTTDVVLVTGILSGVDTSAFALTDQLVLGDDGYFIRPPPDNISFTGEIQLIGSVAKVGSLDGYVVVNVGQGLQPISGSQVFALAGTDGYASASNKYVTDSDPRNTNSRTPTGSAGGNLSGTYPNPNVAAIRETSGPTSLVIGSIATGQGLTRSGSTLIGTSFGSTAGTFADGYDSRFPTTGEKAALAGTNALPSSSNKYVTETDPRNTNSRAPTGSAGGQLGGTYPNPDVRGLRETSGPTQLTIGAVVDGYVLTRSTTSLIGSYLPPLATTTVPTTTTKATAIVGTDQTAARADHKHDISTAAPSQGIGGGSSEGTATTLARSDHNHAIRETGGPTNLTVGSIPDGYYVQRSSGSLVGAQYATSLNATSVTDAGDITTSSVTDVVATTMTLTPGAGNYICWFSSDLKQSANNQDIFISIYLNGVQVTNSQRNFHNNNIVDRYPCSITMLITGVTAGQAIDVRWRVSANTGTMGNRSLTLLRVA